MSIVWLIKDSFSLYVKIKMKKIWDWIIISAPNHNSADSQGGFADYVEVASNAVEDVLAMPEIKPFTKNAKEYEARIGNILEDVIEWYSNNPCKLPPRELYMKNSIFDSWMKTWYYSENGNEFYFNVDMKLLFARILAPSFLKKDTRVCPSVRSIDIGQQFDQEVEKQIKKDQKDYDNLTRWEKIWKKDPSKQRIYRPEVERKSDDVSYTIFVWGESLSSDNLETLIKHGIIEIIDANGNRIDNAIGQLWKKTPMYVKITEEGFQMLKKHWAFKNRKFFDKFD